MGHLSPLTLGSRVCFEDRWKGRLTSLDITEDWEVLNLTISTAGLFSRQSVKLPLSAVKSSSGNTVNIGALSAAAFAREIPPVASPARSVSSETPVATQGMRFAGVLHKNGRVEEVLVSGGFSTYRVPLSHVTFEGARLMFTSNPDDLPGYYFDEDILEVAKAAIRDDQAIKPDEKMHVRVAVDAGTVLLAGNVWTAGTQQYIESLVGSITGVVAIENGIVDDFSLETEIGLALAREGLSHTGIYARARLGEITLYGQTSTPRQADDVQHIIARIPGVTIVRSQLAAAQAAAAL